MHDRILAAARRLLRVPARRALVLLLVLLAGEMLAAGWRRWPLTIAPIHTQAEYQIGQVAITSQHWRREGALARHLMPTRATDYQLTEWSSYDQDYVTVPPLSFVMHYVLDRALPRVEPVFLAKLVAQAQIAAGVLVAGALLYSTFSFWPTLLGLSFLIWTRPFLIWFIDGYFPTTTALVVQLVFVAWTLRRVHEWAAREREPLSEGSLAWRHVVAAAGLALLGAFAESIAIVVNALVAAVFTAMAWSATRARRSRRSGGEWWRISFAIVASTAAAMASVVALYATISDFSATFTDRVSRRTGAKTGRIGIIEHAHVIWRQMHTAWPEWLLLLLAAGALVMTAWIVAALASRRSSPESRAQASVYAAGLALSLLPSLLYHYILQNHVSIHWWFTGTWAIGGVFIIAMCAQLTEQAFAALARDHGSVRLTFGACGAAILIAFVGWAANAAEFRAAGLGDPFPMDAYRALGERLPPDRYPLVATHFVDRALFTQYPYTTAYVRRPVVLLLDDGSLTLPWGGVAANLARLQELGAVYVAYNPFGRRCIGDDVPLAEWPFAWMRVCRVGASQLVKRRSAILEAADITAPIARVRTAAISSHADRWLADLQARLGRGESADNRTELMALARAVRAVGWPDADAVRTVLQRVGPVQADGEPVRLLRAWLDSRLKDPSLPEEVVRAGRGVVMRLGPQGDAAFAGFTVQPLPSAASEVTVYFRPSHDLSGQSVWMHAYPDGSSDYVTIEPKAPAVSTWKAGELAWEVFEVPGTPRHNAYIGVAAGDDLGPAVPLGWIGR